MATATELQQLYVAYFGRPADPAGLDYWVSTGISTKAFAALMFAQPEFQSVNANLSVEAQVNQIYINLFGRSADNAGLLYWTQQINTGKLQLASIANDLIFACNKGAASAADIAALNSKTATALAYTADIRANENALLAYQPQATNPWVSGANFATAVSFMNTATATNQPTAAQITASVATIAASGAPGQTITLTTDKFSYLGGPGNDTFVAPLTTLGGAAVQTLQNLDSIDGAGGTNRLVAVLNQAATTPASLQNIQQVESTFTTVAGTLNLINAPAVATIKNSSSTVAGTFSNIAASATNLFIENTASATTFAYGSTAGTQSVNLSLNGVTGGSFVTLNGIENVALTSTGAASSIAFADNAATSLTIAGSAALTISDLQAAGTTTLTSINASTFTGGLTLTTGAQNGVAGGTVVTISGGAGNDSFTLSGLTPNYTISLGAGDDTIVDANLVGNGTETIDGGLGTDTLSTTRVRAVAASAATPATYTITNIDALTISDALAGQVTAQNISSTINTVTLAGGGTGTLVLGSGAQTVNVGAALTGALTLTDTGTAITDSVTINDTLAASNALADQNVTVNGFETVNINVGPGPFSLAAEQITTLTINPDAASAPVAVNISGSNDFDVNSIVANTTGLLTVNASGISAGTDSPYFRLTGTTLSTGGTQSIIGSAGDDVISVGAFNSTISGGAGDDQITAVAGVDSIDGGAGDDIINSGNGNDTINGGDGDDLINASGTGNKTVDAGAGDDIVDFGANIDLSDVANGGTGTDTFAYSTAIIANAPNITNFEVLQIDAGAAFTQDLSRFTGSTLQRVDAATAQTFTLTNAAAATNSLRAANGSTVSYALASNTSADTLTVGAFAVGGTSTTLTANQIETLNVSAGAAVAGNTLTLANLNATSASAINISGVQNTSVTFAANAADTGTGSSARTITVNAASATGTVTFNGATALATQALTITGSSTAANTLTGGAGADTISGGSAADVITGGLGADSITVGSGDRFNYSAINQTGAVTAFGSQILSGVDVVTGVTAGATRTFSLLGTAVTANAYTAVGAAADGTFVTALNIAGLTGAGTLVDNGAAVERGTYNSLTGGWTQSTTGSDLLFVYDQNGTNGATSYQAILFSGAGSAGIGATNATFAGGNVNIAFA